MRHPSRLLVLAAVCGAAVGVTTAWQLASRSQLQPKSPPCASSTADVGLHTKSSNTLAQRSVGKPEFRSQNVNPDTAQALSDGPSNPVPSSERGSAVTVDAESIEATTPTGDQTPPTPTANSADPAERAYGIVAWGPATDLLNADRLCVTGDPVECLRLAEVEAAATTSSRELDKCRAHRERAYSILVLQCHRRNPDACVTIARMHSLGLSIARDPASERALLARATNLCKRQPGKVCAAFVP